jgi:hypothetical protein
LVPGPDYSYLDHFIKTGSSWLILAHQDEANQKKIAGFVLSM